MFCNSNVNKTVFLVSLKKREIMAVKTITFYKKLYFFLLKALKPRKRDWHQLCFIMLFEKYGWEIQKRLFA